MHKVLRISEQNAFCLHSKERVPFHIIIEVAYDPEKNNLSASDGEQDLDTSRQHDDNPFEESKKSSRNSKLTGAVEKLKSLGGPIKRNIKKKRRDHSEGTEMKEKRNSFGKAYSSVSSGEQDANIEHKKKASGTKSTSSSKISATLKNKLPKKQFFGE